MGIEIEQVAGKTQYQLSDFGLQAGNWKIGSERDGFAQNLNLSFPCHSQSEKFFININRVAAKAGIPAIVDKSLVITDEQTRDEFEATTDQRFRWQIVYLSDPRKTSGDYIEQFELKFNQSVEFHKQPSTQAGFEKIEPNTATIDQDVLGSYAVYQHGLWGRAVNGGGLIHDAGSGKLLHIYRRRLFDTGGRELWLEPKIEKSTDGRIILSVTIPGEFLDSAIYPVYLNDTFGAGEGASSAYPNAGDLIASGKGAPSSDGTATSIDIYGQAATNKSFKVGLYNDSSGPSTKNGSEKETVDAGTWSLEWHQFPTNALSVSNGTNYWCTFQQSVTADIVRYDAVAGTNRYFDSHTYADAWDSSFGVSSSSGAKYSLRCTYTPSVPPTTIAPTTIAPTTPSPTTIAPTTVSPTTLAPTTIAPTTLAPTTVAPTTLVPTTIAPTTPGPTTLPPTTIIPTTEAPTTLPPTTVVPTTPSPTTLAPTTIAPTTIAPTTVVPTTLPPTTLPPTEPPTTVVPTTVIPTTVIPTTVAPTEPPTTVVPTTIIPTSAPPLEHMRRGISNFGFSMRDQWRL